MDSSCEEFESQVSRLNATLYDLESQLQLVKARLIVDSDHADLRSKQRQISLDIRITANELEDAKAKLDLCKRAMA